jgi:hypothetical protein
MVWHRLTVLPPELTSVRLSLLVPPEAGLAGPRGGNGLADVSMTHADLKQLAAAVLRLVPLGVVAGAASAAAVVPEQQAGTSGGQASSGSRQRQGQPPGPWLPPAATSAPALAAPTQPAVQIRYAPLRAGEQKEAAPSAVQPAAAPTEPPSLFELRWRLESAQPRQAQAAGAGPAPTSTDPGAYSQPVRLSQRQLSCLATLLDDASELQLVAPMAEGSAPGQAWQLEPVQRGGGLAGGMARAGAQALGVLALLAVPLVAALVWQAGPAQRTSQAAGPAAAAVAERRPEAGAERGAARRGPQVVPAEELGSGELARLCGAVQGVLDGRVWLPVAGATPSGAEQQGEPGTAGPQAAPALVLTYQVGVGLTRSSVGLHARGRVRACGGGHTRHDVLARLRGEAVCTG